MRDDSAYAFHARAGRKKERREEKRRPGESPAAKCVRACVHTCARVREYARVRARGCAKGGVRRMTETNGKEYKDRIALGSLPKESSAAEILNYDAAGSLV